MNKTGDDSRVVRVIVQVLTIVIFITGTLGNILFAYLLSRKKLCKKASNNFLRIQAIFNALSTATILINEFNSNGLLVYTQSTTYCKLAYSLLYIIPAISAWILAIVSIERFIFIKYGNDQILKKGSFQFIVLTAVTAWNILVYIQIYIYYDVSSDRLYCIITDNHIMFIFDIVDLVNSVAVPFLIMLGCSVAIVRSIYLARIKIPKLKFKKDIKKTRKDIQFSVTIILFNLAFLVLNLPFTIILIFVEWNNDIYQIFMIIYFANFVVPTFIFFFCNSCVKKEFFVLIGRY